MDDEVMTVKQVSEYWKITPWQVRQWASSGILAASKIGKSWRFKRSEIEKFWKKNENSMVATDEQRQTS